MRESVRARIEQVGRLDAAVPRTRATALRQAGLPALIGGCHGHDEGRGDA